MIRYVDDYIDEEYGESRLYISAENQTWDKETLRQLKDEHDIIFMTNGDGVAPVKVIEYSYNDKSYYGIVIGSEDDGTISFDKYYDSWRSIMSEYWIDYLIADLQEAKRYITELKELNETARKLL